jgi:hypothetical protein
MTDNKDTWSRLGKYFEELTDITAGSVKDVGGEWAEMWNTDSDKGTTETAMDAMRESLGHGVRATAKAWVATRQLLLDLAE